MMLQGHWKSTSMPNKYLRDRSSLALESVKHVILHCHAEWKAECAETEGESSESEDLPLDVIVHLFPGTASTSSGFVPASSLPDPLSDVVLVPLVCEKFVAEPLSFPDPVLRYCLHEWMLCRSRDPS